MNSRFASLVVSIALLATGTVAFAAAGTGPFSSSSSTGRSASNSQYCPPGTPNAGKPKKPGPAACGEKPKCKKRYRLATYKRYVRRVVHRRVVRKSSVRRMRKMEQCLYSSKARKKARRFRRAKLRAHAARVRAEALGRKP
jgi:hypothetical protein